MAYTLISQPDLDKNLAKFNTGINTSLPLAVYTHTQEKCQIFASDTGVPVFNATMVTMGCKHAIASGNMTLGWRPRIWNKPNKWQHHWTALPTLPFKKIAPLRDTSPPMSHSPWPYKAFNKRLPG